MNDARSSAEVSGSETLDALVSRARAGDREALAAVLAKVAPAIHRFGLRMCKNAHDADEVLQDTLLSVASHLQDFEGRSSLSSWTFAIARSACAHRRRGLKNRPTLGEPHIVAEPDRAPSPEAQVAGLELASALGAALEGLAEDHREVIQLRDIEELTAPETAASLGITVDAVKSRLHRARAALREALRPMLEADAMPKSGCPDVIALWSRKLEGDLSQGDCAAMEKHLETCASCGTACHALKRALLACKDVRNVAVPPAVQARVKAALSQFAAQVDGRANLPRD